MKPFTGTSTRSEANRLRIHSRPHRGFTMVEMLCTVLVFLILMAVSIPFFLSAQNDAKKKQCRANMVTIANAEEQYKIKSASHVYTTTLSSLTPEIPAVPVCPTGGTYSVVISNGSSSSQSGQAVPNGVLVVSCSSSSHGKYAPTVDAE
jgi:type IV pilus assembly protein PilA